MVKLKCGEIEVWRNTNGSTLVCLAYIFEYDTFDIESHVKLPTVMIPGVP